MSSRVAVLAAVAALAGLLTGLSVVAFDGRPGISDTPVYRSYGEGIIAGEVPYRDFAVEYPPGALIPFVLPALTSSTEHRYQSTFEVTMEFAIVVVAVLLVLALAGLRASATRTLFAVASFLVGVALLGPFTLTRFDLWAAAFTLAAISAVLHGRDRLGSVLLGLAIATKIYPAVLLPLLVARAWRTKGPRAAVSSFALTLGSVLAVYLPFAIVAPEGVVRSLWRQLSRPLQIESTASGVLLALHHAAGMPLGWASSAGSQNLTGHVSEVAAALTTILGLAALLLVWIRYARGNTQSATRFSRYAAAAVVAFVAFGKVASPQFLIWLLAVVVIVPGLRGIAATAVLLFACALTRMWFPRHYWELVKEFDPTASWLVLGRDLALVTLLAILLVRVRAREPAAA